jgi:parallel beta-helix repeat protein
MFLLVSLFLVFSASTTFAVTIYVPDDFPTIQSAIGACEDGDTVLVRDGTYTGEGNRDIYFLGKAIVVSSENGYEMTIIDCERIGRGFYFHSGEGASSVVKGFTIKNGDVPGGQGGGIFCYGSSPTIIQCYFLRNNSWVGGGIACAAGAMPSIDDCLFKENCGRDYGGAIHLGDACNATISNCEFYDNLAEWGSGGAIRCVSASPEISGCTISNNTANNGGGGIECVVNSFPRITSCVFSNNNGGEEGGGIRIGDTASPEIAGCLVYGNFAESGGGIMSEDRVTMINCTIVGNHATNGQGGGIFIGGSLATAAISNSIVWFNEPDQIESITYYLTIEYSDIEGGWSGEGNIDTDPMFVGGNPFDYHLQSGSPCIDAGDPTIFDFCTPPGLGTEISDMGAYGGEENCSWREEEGGSVRNVPGDYSTIQAAIFTSIDGDTVIVAPGKYYEHDIYFLGKAITVMSTDPEDSAIVSATVVDGDSLGSVFVFHSGEDTNSVLTGFTITGGNANWGGGIYCDWSSPSLINNMISENKAIYDGAGIYNYHASPTVINCTLRRNLSDDSGGGMSNIYDSNPIVINCTFNENIADDTWPGGGGMRNGYNSNPMIINCTFSGNKGSGMVNADNSSPTVTSCTFIGNSANEGGGIRNVSSSPMISDCRFSGNIASYHGGGMDNGFDSSPTIANSVFIENRANEGGGMYNISSNATVTNCMFSENIAGNGGGGGVNNWDCNPTFINSVFSENTTFSRGGGMLNVFSSSPEVINCTFSENIASYDGGGMHNKRDSNPTIVNCIFWNDSPYEISNSSSCIPIVTYSNVQGGYIGEGNINAPPFFMTFHGFDYLLRPGSPCIDSGDPAIEDGYDWPKQFANGLRSDMGAYGGPGNVRWFE